MRMIDDATLLGLISVQAWFREGTQRRCEALLLQLCEQADDYAKYLVDAMCIAKTAMEKLSTLTAVETQTESVHAHARLRQQAQKALIELTERFRRLEEGPYRYCLPSSTSILYCDDHAREIRERLVYRFERTLKHDTAICCGLLNKAIEHCLHEEERSV